MKAFNIIFFFASLLAIVILYFDLIGATNLIGNNTASFASLVGLCIPFLLLFLGYVQLRESKFYIAWLLLSIVMLVFYFHFKDFEALNMKRGSALKSFKSLFSFLILFQLGRLILLKVAGHNYITPSRGGRSDIIEGKIPEPADYIMFFVLFFSIILAQEL